MKKCPFCAEEIQDAAVVCKHCHKEIGAGAIVGNGLKAAGAVLTLFVTLPILWFLFFGSSITPSSALSTITGTPAPASGVTLAKFEALKEGMTYAQAVGILGTAGTEQSRMTLGDTTTVMYAWQGSGGFGANMNAMFQNDRLMSKAQFGLR